MYLLTDPNRDNGRSDVASLATILVVDDQPCLRAVAATILNRCGYRVLAAANGDEAMRIAGEHANIDLLLTDLEMPGMDGVELARWFHANRPEMPICFMSGNPIRLRSLGSCWAVEKPFIHIDVLVKTIRQALEHRHPALTSTRAAA